MHLQRIRESVTLYFSRVQPGDATLLGAPLFPARVLNDFWSDRCRDLSRAVDRLCLVGRRHALILLRASFSLSVQYRKIAQSA